MQKHVKEDRYNHVAFPEEGGFLKDGFLHAGVCLVFLLNIMNELMLIRCLIFMHEVETKFCLRVHKILPLYPDFETSSVRILYYTYSVHAHTHTHTHIYI